MSAPMEHPQSAQLSLFDAAGRREPFSVRVSRRARRLSVRVHAGGNVEVIVPPGVRGRDVHAFVGRHQGWIERKVAQLKGAAVPYEDPGKVPSQVRFAASGEAFSIAWRPAGRARLVEATHGIEIASHSAEAARETLRRWLIDAAQWRLEPWLREVAETVGIAFGTTTVRRQKTRWGSCSARGDISLNCCLLFQPADVVRYLFVHELAHIRHPNHSDSFWRHVERFEPHYRDLDRQLLAGWANVPAWVFGP